VDEEDEDVDQLARNATRLRRTPGVPATAPSTPVARWPKTRTPALSGRRR